MAKIVAVHSYRGGTGKSQIAANVAVLLAAKGLRVALVDTDVQTPAVHVLFGRYLSEVTWGLSDYLLAECEIDDIVHDLSAEIDCTGALFVVPSRAHPETIIKMAVHGYDVALLSVALQQLSRQLRLDALLLDTHPGINGETMVALAVANTLVVVIRPDPHELSEAAVTDLLSRRLSRHRTVVVVNMMPPRVDIARLRDVALAAYAGDFAVMLPYSEQLAGLAGQQPIVLPYPDHEISHRFGEIAAGLGIEPAGRLGSGGSG